MRHLVSALLILAALWALASLTPEGREVPYPIGQAETQGWHP